MNAKFSSCPACGKLHIHGARCVCGQPTNLPGPPFVPTVADAWEEGYEAAYGDLLDRDPHRTKNPYQKDNNHA